MKPDVLKKWTPSAILLLALAASSGCGGAEDRPPTAAVSGTVAYKGAAVEGATVSFMMEGAPRVASGVTDKDGKFKLSTFALNDGAVIGTHTITVTKDDPKTGLGPSDDALLKDPGALAGQMQKMADEADVFTGVLPEKYSAMTTSPLSETVSEDASKNEFVIQLAD